MIRGTKFWMQPEYVAKAKPLRPPPPRAIGKPVMVQPRTKNYPLVGAAFDYLLRFEFKRRCPHAITRPWIARSSLRLLFDHPRHADGICRSPIPDAYLAAMAPLVAADSLNDLGHDVIYYRVQTSNGSVQIGCPIEPMPGEVFHDLLPVSFKIGRRMLHIVREAEADYESYIQKREVSLQDQGQMAWRAIQLAKIDMVARSATVDAKMLAAPDAADVEDLTALLEIVPYDLLLDPDTMILNPSFVGADADLISGDKLIDVKATVKAALDPSWIDQLLGYYLLARHERKREASFPEIRRLGLYFARHGAFLQWPVSVWTRHPQFDDVEAWFRSTMLAGLA